MFSRFCTSGATVAGTLQDISLQALNTRLTFAPTNDVLLTATGLSAGPPRTIATTNGQFSIVLEAGDYVVSLPLIPWRRPFPIAVFETNGVVNITNLLSAPHTYTYVNDWSYAVKTTDADVTPGRLDAKLAVSGSLAKLLQTNAGAVTLLLSNAPAGPAGALHVNVGPVVSWSTNGERSLLDGTVTIPGGSLSAGKVVRVEAFGAFSDPGLSLPNVTFRLKLGSTTIVTQTKGITTANWHLSGSMTVRSAGNPGTIAGALALIQDLAGADPLSLGTQTAGVNTTTNLVFDLRASIDNATDAEKVVCEQAVITLD